MAAPRVVTDFLHLAFAFPLLGGAMVALPGGRVEMRAAHNHFTLITPATDPQHLDPGIDLEASLLAGRRVEVSGLLQRPGRPLLVLQRAQDLKAAASQRIARWFDTTAPANRPPILAVVDENVAELPPWLDSRLAFRLAASAEPLLWSPPPRPTGALATSHAGEPDLALLRTVSCAATARGLGDPRYDLMTYVAALARAALESRTVEQSDITWAINHILDPRAPLGVQESSPPTTARQQNQSRPPQPTSSRPKPRATSEAPGHTTGEEPAETSSSPGAPPTNPASEKDAGMSPMGDMIPAESFHSRQINAASTDNHNTAFFMQQTPGHARGKTSPASSASGRFGKALPHPTGRPGRQMLSRPPGQLDLGATLRAAAPWQALRPQLTGSRMRIYPQDLRFRTRERRPGSTAVIMLDASASMWARHIAQAKGIALHLIEQAYRNRSNVAIVAIHGTQPELLVPTGRNYSLARSSVQSLEVGGGTPLLPAIQLAVSLLPEANEAGQASIYILTDGRGNSNPPRPGEPDTTLSGSDDTLRRCGELMKTAGASVQVIGIAPPGRQRAAYHLAECLQATYRDARELTQITCRPGKTRKA